MSMPLPAERGVPSHSEEWVLHSPELVIGRASIAPLVRGSPLSMPLSAERLSFHSFWGMSSPLSRAHGWACRSLLSGGVPSHSEEWVLHSPELVIGLTLRSEFSALELLIGSWVPLIPRNESSALQGSPSVELALLPSTRGSPMSMPLPSERPSFSAPQSSVMGAPLNQRVTYEHAAPFWASV